MKSLPGVIFESKILCEEVRQEKSNKFILLGVYSGNILVGNLPAHIPLAMYFDTRLKAPGPHEFWLRLSGPGEGHFTATLKVVTAEPDQIANLVTPRLEVLMECEGTLKIEASVDQKRWISLIEKEVIKGEGIWSLTPIAVEQPEQSQTDAPGTASQPEPSRPGSPRKRRRS